MSAKRRPIVCAIDLGYEFTKVSVSFPNGDKYPEVPSPLLWPSSNPPHALRTTVVYAGGMLEIGTQPWVRSQATPEVFEHFKLKALNPERYGSTVLSSNGESQRPASEVLRAFLCRLYAEIRNNIGGLRLDMAERWRTIDIDFAFSVPGIVGLDGAARLTSMAKECNFEQVKGRHEVIDVRITEPEAAGVYLLRKHKSHIKRGDVAMVFDLGGGTSDLSMIAMGSDDKWKLDMDLVPPVSSDRFGAASIDRSVRGLAEEYVLRHNPGSSEASSIALEVTNDRDYLAAKVGMRGLKVRLDNPGISAAETSGELYVKGDELILKGALFTRLLDELIYGVDDSGGIAGLANTMRDDLYARGVLGVARAAGNESALRRELGVIRMDHVFFAGGLGGSAYLRGRIQGELQSTGEAVSQKLVMLTKDTRFHEWDKDNHNEAQLCVVFGIAGHRVEEIMQEEGKPRFKFRSWLRSFAR